MAEISSSISATTLSENGLNFPIKREKTAQQIRKHDLQETNFRCIHKYMENERMKKDIPCK